MVVVLLCFISEVMSFFISLCRRTIGGISKDYLDVRVEDEVTGETSLRNGPRSVSVVRTSSCTPPMSRAR